MPSIKAITLYQPWASLIVVGAKHFETRSWRTKHRGMLAIHAGLNLSYRHLALEGKFMDALVAADLNPDDLPFGAVVGWVDLNACFPVASVINSISARELAFGDFSPGRFAWRLACPWRLPSAFPTSGRQGLWTWDAPDGWNHEAYPALPPEQDPSRLHTP